VQSFVEDVRVRRLMLEVDEEVAVVAAPVPMDMVLAHSVARVTLPMIHFPRPPDTVTRQAAPKPLHFVLLHPV
jgi:hypothetical protein